MQVVPCDVAVAETLVKRRSLRDAVVHRAARRSAGTSSPSPARSACCSSSAATPRCIVHDDAPLEWACDRVVAGRLRVRRAGVHQGAAPLRAPAASPTRSSRASSSARARSSRRSPLDPSDRLRADDRRGQREARRAVGRRGRAAPVPRVLCGGRRDGNRYWPDGARDSTATAAASRSSTKRCSARCSPCTATTRGTTRSRWPTRRRYGLQAGVFTDSRARVGRGVRAPPRRRPRRQRRPDLPRRLDALRRRARLGPRPRGRALRHRRDDRAQAPRRAGRMSRS